jgi:predicted component of type VI protein secretion system
MNQLTLEWVEAGQLKTHTFNDRQSSKHPGTFRIGRDPARCDLVVQHPTVSKLHVELFLISEQKTFYLRNLRETNPPIVDRKRLTQGVVGIRQGSTILLGDLEIRVKAVDLSPNVPPTIVAQQAVAAIHPGQSASPQPIAAPQASPQQAAMPYGLQCPKCNHVSPYEHLEIGCAWCGTSLASAQSVLMVPQSVSRKP